MPAVTVPRFFAKQKTEGEKRQGRRSTPEGRRQDAAVSIAIRLRRIDGFCLRQNPRPKTGKDAGFWPAQGIGGARKTQRVLSVRGAVWRREWSEAEPRKARSGHGSGRMRPKKENEDP
jgi:hypothetical protein